MLRWARVVGDGLVAEGPCVVHDILIWPDVDTDYTDIYDGRDTSSGKKFCRIETATSTTLHFHFDPAVFFDRGVYVDGADSAVETTIVFDPVTE